MDAAASFAFGRRLRKEPFFFTVNATTILLAVHIKPLGFGNAFFPALAKIAVIEGDSDLVADSFSHSPDEIVSLKFAVQKGAGKIVEPALLGNPGRGGEAFVIAQAATLCFPKGHVSDESLQVVAFLVYNPEVDPMRISLQGFLPSQAFLKGMDIMSVKVTHNCEPLRAKGVYGIDAAGPTADVKQYFQFRSPKMAVPMRTRVAPAAMATSKSPDIPMESSSIDMFGVKSGFIFF